jgi:hypothetical protein
MKKKNKHRNNYSLLIFCKQKKHYLLSLFLRNYLFDTNQQFNSKQQQQQKWIEKLF